MVREISEVAMLFWERSLLNVFERKGTEMDCRVGCGACCIAPSISSAIPGMPHGKSAGVRCIQLPHDTRCKLYGKPERRAICELLQPSEDICGHSSKDALPRLIFLERATAPFRPASL